MFCCNVKPHSYAILIPYKSANQTLLQWRFTFWRQLGGATLFLFSFFYCDVMKIMTYWFYLKIINLKIVGINQPILVNWASQLGVFSKAYVQDDISFKCLKRDNKNFAPTNVTKKTICFEFHHLYCRKLKWSKLNEIYSNK